MNKCKFCQIVDKQLPSWVVYENEKVMCILPHEIEAFGHTLVIPKKHYVDLYDIPADVLSELVRVSKEITLSYKEKIGATGMNLMHASGKNGQQSVFHFHIHLCYQDLKMIS